MRHDCSEEAAGYRTKMTSKDDFRTIIVNKFFASTFVINCFSYIMPEFQYLMRYLLSLKAFLCKSVLDKVSTSPRKQ